MRRYRDKMIGDKVLEKLHTACDECRTRKLKCSGDTPECARCKREKLSCVYSPQKQMGRPRKRRREEIRDEPRETSAEVQIEPITALNEAHPVSGLYFQGISPPESQDHEYSSLPTDTLGVSLLHNDSGLGASFSANSMPALDFGKDSIIDPSLWNTQSLTIPPDIDNHVSPSEPLTGPCTCLSQMYLILTELQCLQSFAFPQIVVPLRKAMVTLSDIIYCTRCPQDPFNAIQNIQAIVSLFKSIVERFSKVLMEVDKEASHLEATGQKKLFRIGDNNPALHHLHTGTLDCPMGFNIDLAPRDWRRLVKQALKTEIYGGGSNPRPLLDLLNEAQARQQKWHSDKTFWNSERTSLFPLGHAHYKDEPCHALGERFIREMCESLVWE